MEKHGNTDSKLPYFILNFWVTKNNWVFLSKQATVKGLQIYSYHYWGRYPKLHGIKACILQSQGLITVCWKPYCITKQFCSFQYNKTLFQGIWIEKAFALDHHVSCQWCYHEQTSNKDNVSVSSIYNVNKEKWQENTVKTTVNS